MRRRALAAAAVVVLALAGCAPTTDAPDNGGQTPDGPKPRVADVDTPELRAIKAKTGIEPCAVGTGEPVEGGLPDLTLPCLGGGEAVNLGSLRGPMVVNLWAQWCGPCKTEMPIYARFDEQHGDRVAVIGINYSDQYPADALEFAQRSGVTYPQLADPAATLIGPFLAPSDALPIHVFVDADGKIERVAAVIKSLEQLEQLAEQHLGVTL
jgi:thiol-disulfide isomerase/thioredoxin